MGSTAQARSGRDLPFPDRAGGGMLVAQTRWLPLRGRVMAQGLSEYSVYTIDHGNRLEKEAEDGRAAIFFRG
jgi:hypothetical protein